MGRQIFLTIKRPPSPPTRPRRHRDYSNNGAKIHHPYNQASRVEMVKDFESGDFTIKYVQADSIS